jgi:hypothetical protein
MGKASSSKKVARAARAGGRASGVRQRNLLFPSVLAAVFVLGAALLAVAWNDHRGAAADVPPRFGDHWHAAYGVYICDEYLPTSLVAESFDNREGIHSHGDEVIHIHPHSRNATGERARMGVYLEDSIIDVSDSELSLDLGDDVAVPPDLDLPEDLTWRTGEDTCDGEPGELVLAHWSDVTSDERPAIISGDFEDARFRRDGEGFALAFVPEGTTDIPKPPTAEFLVELGAADAEQVFPPEGEVPEEFELPDDFEVPEGVEELPEGVELPQDVGPPAPDETDAEQSDE